VMNATIEKGIHFDLDNEAMRVVQLFPDFKPALKNGMPVNCDMVLNLNFTLACSADDYYFSSEDDYRLKYPGGFSAMFTSIFDHITYSGSLEGFQFNGKSVFSFDVDTNGSIKNIKVVNATSSELERNVIEALQSLEKFRPGSVYGVKQTGHITFPVKYKRVVNSEGESKLDINREFSFGRVEVAKEEYSFIDELPSYDAIFNGLVKNLELPAGEEKNKKKGTVFVRCFISDEGKIINPHIYKGLTPALEEEALRAVSKVNYVSPALRMSKPIGFELLVPVSYSNF
ncbi:MAG: energy transducer TonB, partial [Bacteroidota bacterium]